jgi:hypothetical protein
MADFNDKQIELIYNNKYEVLTPDGFKPFTGILSGKNELYKVTLSNDMELLATKKHKIIINENRDHKTVEELCVGEAVLTSQGSFFIKNISNVNEIENNIYYKNNKNIDVFEFFNVKDNHSYISNNIFCKQCLFLDEFGFIKSHIADEFIASVFPTISSGKTTKVIITSTPQGMNHFYRMWEDAKGDKSKGLGGNGFERLEIPWNAVPGRDEEWAREQIAQIGQIRFNQEFRCQFIGSVSTLIDHNFLQDLKYKEHMRIPKLPEYVKIWELPRPKAEMEAKEWEYVASLDSGYGMHADNTVLQICLVKSNITIHQVAKMSSNSMDIDEFCKKANALLKRYHCPTLIIEQNGPGIAATNFFHNHAEYENLVHFDPRGKHMGLWATERMKDNACVLLKSYVQRGFLHLNDTDTINELYSFGKTASTKFGGMGGTHDDHITSIYWIPYYVNSPFFHGKVVEVNLKTFKEEEGILSTDEERSAEITAYNNLSNLNKYMEEIENASKYLSVQDNDDSGLSSTGYGGKKPINDDDDDGVSGALVFRH